MTTYLMVYRWLFRPTSRSGSWAILNRAQEETQTIRAIDQLIPPSWYNFEEREQEIPSFLHDVLRNIRAVTHDFTEAPGEDHDEVELAVSVLTALMVLRSVGLPGMAQQTCLMCGCPVTESTPWRRNPTRVRMEHRHLSSCGRWTLHEICIFPSWREVVDSPRLCAIHACEFSRALEAVLGFVARQPVGTMIAATHFDSCRPRPSFSRRTLDGPPVNADVCCEVFLVQ